MKLKYAVAHVSLDGLVSTAKFTNARSTLDWVDRLRKDDTKFDIYRFNQSDFDPGITRMALDELKKEAALCPTLKKTTGKSSKRR